MTNINSYYLYAGSIIIPDGPANISTILGSCVSVCLYDERRGTGGMNHFKSPYQLPNKPVSADYGDIAIKELLGGMIKNGSRRSDIVAKVFGGGSVVRYTIPTLQIGKLNIEAALTCLEKLRIPITHKDLGGKEGRRVLFNTSEGTFKVRRINNLENSSLLKNECTVDEFLLRKLNR